MTKVCISGSKFKLQVMLEAMNENSVGITSTSQLLLEALVNSKPVAIVACGSFSVRQKIFTTVEGAA